MTSVMKRQSLPDGRWFDAGKSTVFCEDDYFDGSNRISKATGSQWNHEEVYLTRSGAWVLHWWSQWQGSNDQWSLIDRSEAVVWLMDNDHSDALDDEDVSELEA